MDPIEWTVKKLFFYRVFSALLLYIIANYFTQFGKLKAGLNEKAGQNVRILSKNIKIPPKVV